MRQGQNNKRARGRGRKPQSAANRTYDSNGPDVKIRGTASQIAEKYVALSRDAQVSGDPVASENYLQHAEHYLRIIAHAQAQHQSQHQIQNQSQNQNIAPVPGSGAQPSVVNGEDAAEGARETRRETRQETRKGAADGASGGPADPPSHGAANGEAGGEVDGRSRRPGGRRGRPGAVADAGAPADAEAAPAPDAADEGSPSPKSGGDDPVVAEAG